MSWVTLTDVVRIICFALEEGTVRGPINAVSPQPVRNAEFTKEIARVLHRPAMFAAPEFALKLALGEMAGMLLASQRVLPIQLEKLGYKFVHPELGSALAATLP